MIILNYIFFKLYQFAQRKKSFIDPVYTAWAAISLFLLLNLLVVMLLFFTYVYPLNLVNLLSNKILFICIGIIFGTITYFEFVFNNNAQKIMNEFKNDTNAFLGNILVGLYVFITFASIIIVPIIIGQLK